MKNLKITTSLALTFLLTSFTSLAQAEIDQELSTLINRHKLTGTPKAAGSIPNINSPLAQLGMKLFYTKTLGGDKTTACVSCHHPMLGGGDNLSLPIGVGSENPDVLGVHRKLSSNTQVRIPRNAPTTFNVVFWKKALFHDMRIEKIADKGIYTPDLSYPKVDALSGENLVQAQARFPITSPDEMRGDFLKDSYNQTLRRSLAKRLEKNWLNDFRKGFSYPDGSTEELITEQNFSEAIAEYERSQVFINSPWKAYVEGNRKALSKSEKEGAKLFYTAQANGGAGCVQCHNGDFFTDENAYNTAMPQIGAGTDSGASKSNDIGCKLVTNKDTDKFRFRTPSLLNVEVTGPWGHDGAYTSLEAITQHMLSPIQSAKKYDASQLTQKNIALNNVTKNTLEAIKSGVHLSSKKKVMKSDVKHLVAFLKALTDPCVKNRACLSAWIPNKNYNDPDGQMLHARSKASGGLL